MQQIIEALGIDWRLILTQFLGFIVLLFLLKQFVFSKVFGILDERQNDIKRTYDQLDADRASMESSRQQYEQRLAGIEAQAREQIQAAVKDGQALRDSLVADARRQVETIIEQGRNDLERERQAAFLEMRSQIVSIAMAAASKVVGENLTDARQTKLVDDFIGNVGLGSVSDAGRGVSGNVIADGAATSGAGKGAAAY